MHTHKRNLSGGILILSLTHFSPAIFEGIDHQLSLSLSNSDTLHKLFHSFPPSHSHFLTQKLKSFTHRATFLLMYLVRHLNTLSGILIHTLSISLTQYISTSLAIHCVKGRSTHILFRSCRHSGQCDRIGRFLKVQNYLNSCKSRPNAW